MPQTKALENSDTDNIESEATNLDRNGAGTLDGAIGQPLRRLGSPQEDVSRVGSMTQPVDSPHHDATHPAAKMSAGDGKDADQLGNETGQNADTPVAGDVDPDSTRSAEETGQDGDPSEPKKSHGHPYDQ